MPYISPKHRQTLDPLIDKLAMQIVHEAQVLRDMMRLLPAC